MSLSVKHTPTWNVDADDWVKAKNFGVSDIAANRFLVPDSTGEYGVKLPVAASTPTVFAGIGFQPLKAGKTGDVVSCPGCIVVAVADGSIAIADSITISTTATKEGMAKTAGGTDFVVGSAVGACADGEYVMVRLTAMSK